MIADRCIRQPIPVCLTRKDLKAELERAINSTYLHQNRGTCAYAALFHFLYRTQKHSIGQSKLESYRSSHLKFSTTSKLQYQALSNLLKAVGITFKLSASRPILVSAYRYGPASWKTMKEVDGVGYKRRRMMKW